MSTCTAQGNFIPFEMAPFIRIRIPENEPAPGMQEVFFVLDCIAFLMQGKMSSLGSKELTILNNPEAPNPMCIRSSKQIILCTGPGCWSQAAYQFAHELCHYAIPDHVPQNLRWIEESVCQLASIYFLHAISEMWRIRKLPLRSTDGKPYYPAFSEFAENNSLQAEEFDFQNQTVLAYLESECEDRPKNKHLANHLLPIFTEHPDTWQAVPFLCQVHEPSLQKAFDAWIQISPPAAQPGLRQFRGLFGFPDSDQSDLPGQAPPASS